MYRFMQALIPGTWLLWLAYWTFAARQAKPTSRTESLASRASHILPLGIGIALLFTDVPGSYLAGSWLPRGAWTFWIGFALVAAGVGFSIWARVHLAGNWSGTVTLKQGHSLTRTGPYRLVRHPIYTGLLVGVLGSAINNGTRHALLGLLFVAIAFWRKIGIEEQFLGGQFGEDYARYRAEVPALIPGLHR
jgi:protein-S-isoprenylcysteine O-methyltransferase Ste14